jgi:RNA polymerase sigma-70 factor (ECF subfamily)
VTNHSDMGERLLVAKCVKGDHSAWEEFFRRHYGAISSVASWRKWRFDPHELEDVKQEVTLQIIKSIETFSFKSSLGTFVYKIAVNTCIAHLRRKRALKRKADCGEVALDPIESGTEDENWAYICATPNKNQEELFQERETLESLKKALFNMDDRCKELIDQRYFEEISFQEISQQTGVKVNTLIIRLKRCMARLLITMEEDDGRAAIPRKAAERREAK